MVFGKGAAVVIVSSLCTVLKVLVLRSPGMFTLIHSVSLCKVAIVCQDTVLSTSETLFFEEKLFSFQGEACLSCRF